MSKPSHPVPGRALSGFGGWGTGSLLVGAALDIGATRTVAVVLVLIAPAATVFGAHGFYLLHTRVVRRRRRQNLDKKIAALDRGIKDRRTSPDDRERYKRIRARLMQQDIELGFEEAGADAEELSWLDVGPTSGDSGAADRATRPSAGSP